MFDHYSTFCIRPQGPLVHILLRYTFFVDSKGAQEFQVFDASKVRFMLWVTWDTRFTFGCVSWTEWFGLIEDGNIYIDGHIMDC